MDGFLNNILSFFNSFYVVGSYMEQDLTTYQFIELSYYKKELKVKKRLKTKELGNLKNELKKGFPVLLHLEGSNVINKSVANNPNYRNEIIFKANSDDFYFYEQKFIDNIFVSVIRKEIANSLIEELNSNGNLVIDFSVGPFVLANLIMLDLDQNEFKSPFFSVTTNAEQIESFNEIPSGDNFSLSIENETFNGYELPLISLFIGHTFSNNAENNFAIIEKNRSEQKFKTYFKVFGVSFLTVIMLSLMIGHFTLNNLVNKLAEKEAKYVLTQESSNKINAMNEEISLKERILQSSGLNNFGYMSKYISDIGNSVGSGVALNVIDIFPIKKKIRQNEKVNYVMNEIILEGETTNDKDFSNWISNLNLIDWIKKIEIESYEQQSNLNTFKIKISI